MRVLVACEYSGKVRSAFEKAGHYAMSCDLHPTVIPGNHYQGDVFDIIHDDWDLMIAHPECKYLCLSGARWFGDPKYPNREYDFENAVEFFLKLWNADIPRICIENSQPLGRTLERVGRYNQVVQPWMFGEPYTKGAYLWLKNLPPLIPSHQESDFDVIIPAVHWQPPSDDRSKLRAETYSGVANAMADQWGLGKEPEWKYGLFAKTER